MSGSPEPLPELPDLEQLRHHAELVRDHYTAVIVEATVEKEKAEAYLAALDGPRKAQVTTKPRSASEKTYRTVLTKLAEHAYAGISTLASESTVSRGHVGVVMALAERRGHVQRKDGASRRRRYTLTEDGMEYLTQPEAPVSNGHARLEFPELKAALRSN